MDFDFSDDQKLLKAEARKFLRDRCPPATVRAVLDDSRIPYDAELWRMVAGMGWLGAAIPERFGGAGLSHIDLCAIAEELGRATAPIPFVSTVYLFAECILAFGSEAQRAQYLPGVVDGTVIGCLASSEGAGPITAAAIASRVEDGEVTGIKLPVTDGDVATHAIVVARDDDGVGLFVVDLNGPGVIRRVVETLDPTRSAARITFDDAACERLGSPGQGESMLSSILDRAAVLVAFEQVGGADACLEAATGYALHRHAFGRAIGSYQAIKHKLADIYVKNELARANAYYGAWALNSGAPELRRAAAAARIAGSIAYDFAAKENLQVHGGIGFTWEMDCHVHLRRARQLALTLGGPPVWRERLVRALEDSSVVSRRGG